MHNEEQIKNVDIKNYWARRISGINLIRYAKDRKIGKPNNLKVFRRIKPKDINRIAKIS
jgi:hypothetical protein